MRRWLPPLFRKKFYRAACATVRSRPALIAMRQYDALLARCAIMYDIDGSSANTLAENADPARAGSSVVLSSALMLFPMIDGDASRRPGMPHQMLGRHIYAPGRHERHASGTRWTGQVPLPISRLAGHCWPDIERRASLRTPTAGTGYD